LSFNIAVAGKGGSGKTSLSSLIIRYLIKNNLRPVLAVDADPNANLGESLGLNVQETVGMVLARFQKEKIDIPSGMTKESYLEYRLNSILMESNGLDLLSMGRGEGQDCYCYPNAILRKFVDRLSCNYAYTVMDNEAGMEHLSRGTTQDIDVLLIVSNHSVKGARTISRIRELVKELQLRVKKEYVVISVVPDCLDPLVADELNKLNLAPDVIIPQDELVYRADLKQTSLLELPDSSPAVKAVDLLMTQILIK
jgi:CO dehydrogenase maturation factor